MTSNLIGRRPVLAPLLIAIFTLAVLLVAPRQTSARGSKATATCASARAKRETHACAQRARHSVHARSKGKRHHAKHAAARKKAKRTVKRAAAPTPAAPSSQETPLCEDGTAPVQLGQGGIYACDDESEPVCANGSEATPSASATLLCPALAGEGPGSTPPICEDESTPIPAGGGAYSCDDGSEPECEDGSSPTLSSGGSALVCPPVADAEGASSSAEDFESAL